MAQTTMDQAQIMQMLIDIVQTDMREFSELRRGACRYCHGTNHLYRWRTEAEYDEACTLYAGQTDAQRALRTPPNDDEGYGHRGTAPPHPDCPMCDGLGELTMIQHDRRGYSTGAAITFDGVVPVAGGGYKIKSLSRLKAADQLARIMGLYQPSEAEQAVDGLASMNANIQQRGSKAPVKAQGDPPPAPVAATKAPKAE